jgi:hypothetical protein
MHDDRWQKTMLGACEVLVGLVQGAKTGSTGCVEALRHSTAMVAADATCLKGFDLQD